MAYGKCQNSACGQKAQLYTSASGLQLCIKCVRKVGKQNGKEEKSTRPVEKDAAPATAPTTQKGTRISNDEFIKGYQLSGGDRRKLMEILGLKSVESVRRRIRKLELEPPA